MSEQRSFDVIIIGGGQAGLSVAYYLQMLSIDYLIIDENDQPGGSWTRGWDSLLLFSPGIYSSLSGWMIPTPQNIKYTSKDEFVNYLSNYEKRYDMPIERGVTVHNVEKSGKNYIINTGKEKIVSKIVVACTGATSTPYIPKYEGIRDYKGQILHSFYYRNINQLKGDNILIVGGGNSAAQIVSEVSKSKKVQWATKVPPKFLPDDVDGRYLFDLANKDYPDEEKIKQKQLLGDIVMLEEVKLARDRGDLTSRRSTFTFTERGVMWEDKIEEPFDAVIWCTGFRPNFSFLKSLEIVDGYKIKTCGTKILGHEGLWAVGYGDWTGYSSATIYGVGKTAQKTVEEISLYLLNYDEFDTVL
ncbi:NAD(P)-binding domain-containing protein [Flammeovirga yaeyamensis]|uniref:NAD(P)-binding domain-containing protein n=1 Tax=Flammeovirga yaeyamensis TaxID=367791 RepID=A0AAX1N359_9BACT|nr:NAD(P)-binding domain-containing protein [Flammeovirga yaeyamensis]MBB3695890.1 thioredoxin reductase [Flammeovirga yaeyamensis]NMF34579.1 NAD(P)-binding domain-containing protein [Flammeovirga yaeyamensis]QWG00590.1 NAD(P)-binding domain-containing protein [Flammeovirga yaeyamensis]